LKAKLSNLRKNIKPPTDEDEYQTYDPITSRKEY
jgi:hypothetical protein